MTIDATYSTRVNAVLLAARDLQDALKEHESDEIGPLANDVLSAALSRETGGVVAGFRDEPDGVPFEPSAVGTLEEELSLALTELEVGEVLLASAAVTKPDPSDQVDASATLGEAIDQLEAAQGRLSRAGDSLEQGLFGGAASKPEDFFVQLPATLDGIVQRTSQVGLATINGLVKIPAAQLQPLFGAGLGAVEAASDHFGALVRAGMRAIRRALNALTRLVPHEIREKVGGWAKEWWDKHASSVTLDIVRRSLSVAEVQAAIAEAVADAQSRSQSPKDLDAQAREKLDGDLRVGASRLLELDERHKRITSIIERIVGALSRLIGPLVLAFPPAALWIYGSGGSGLVAALGVTLWIGRDYLDTGVPFERIDGIRLVVIKATGFRHV